jgi:hypothetical protein
LLNRGPNKSLLLSAEAAMKIEYLAGDQPPLPLVRLFHFRPDEVNALRAACDDLANGRTSEFAVHQQAWVQPVNGCRFVWRASRNDVGVRVPEPDQPLVLEYSDEAWREVEGKLSQFVEPRPHTSNWLTNEGDVDVLISMDGNW